MAGDKADRRRAPRCQVVLKSEAAIDCDGRNSYFGLVSELSEVGCRIVIDEAMPEQFGRNTALNMKFLTEGFAVDGEVARIAEVVDGWGIAVGIDFKPVDSETKTSLKRIYEEAQEARLP